MQLFGVDSIRDLGSPINGRMLGPETGLQTSCDTMLFGEQKGQDVILNTQYLLHSPNHAFIRECWIT